jgi:CheY-like chemotaxis protein
MVSFRFEVADTGIGIDPRHQERMFDSFAQVDASTTRRYGGTGLGLAVSQQLIALMGGRIGVDSEAGKGSTFWFEISLDRSTEARKPMVLEHSGIKDLKVLVVDDNETNRIVFGDSLRGWGMRPTMVADGKTAIETMLKAVEEGDPFRLALLDLNMPGMDGLELAAAINRDSRLRDIKPMLLTSSAQRHDLEVAGAAGIHAYLTKPVKQSALYDTIAAVIGNTSVDSKLAMVTGYKVAEARYGTRRRILVAEDNLVNQKVAAQMLEKLGHRVDIAANGSEAVAAVEAIDYDVVLMDCQMPVMDGYEATIEIRKSPGPQRRIPIIAMTASAMKADEDKALAAGMDAYISKPVKIEDLAAILDRTLGVETDQSADDNASVVVIPTGPALDPAVVASLRELDGDTGAFFLDFMQAFLRGIEERFDELLLALVEDEWQEPVNQLAHSLKGSCGSAGAMITAEICRDIEEAVASGDKERADALAAELKVELERVRAEVADELMGTTPRGETDLIV